MARTFNPRHIRLLRALSRRWQRRVIFTGGAFAVGLAAVGMAILSDGALHAFQQLLRHAPYAAFAVTPAGFGLSVWLAGRFFPNTQGSGIPQVIAARAFKAPEDRARLVGLRAGIGKMLLTLLGLLVGASVGREGPTVQIGASLMFAIGRLTPRRQPGLILAGAAAGVAAAFNTPLAGIVFAIEEISRSFEARASGLIIGAVILAGLTSLYFLGNYTYFGSSGAMLATGSDWLAVPVCGLAGGILGGTFSRLLIVMANGIPGRIGSAIKSHPVMFAISCGFMVAVCGYLSDGAAFGTGYAAARGIIHGTHPLPPTFMPLKLVATALSSISGIPGGIFSPSLSVGAGLGADIALLFPNAPLGPIILLGMVAYFTGVVQAPITSFVIVSEMTGNHQMLVPLMATAVIANACSRLICREGVYHALAKRYLQPEPLKTIGIRNVGA